MKKLQGHIGSFRPPSGEKNTGGELETKKKEKLENDSNYGPKIEVEKRA